MGYVKFSKLNTTYNIILLRIFFYLMYTVFNKKNKNVHTKIKRTRHELYCFCSIHDRLIHSTWTSVQTLDIWKCLFYLNGFILSLYYYYLIWFRDKRDRKWYVHKSKYDNKTFIIAHVIKKAFHHHSWRYTLEFLKKLHLVKLLASK